MRVELLIDGVRAFYADGNLREPPALVSRSEYNVVAERMREFADVLKSLGIQSYGDKNTMLNEAAAIKARLDTNAQPAHGCFGRFHDLHAIKDGLSQCSVCKRVMAI